LNEIEFLGKLRHPNIVTLMAAYVQPQQAPILVSELMAKGSLYDVLHRDALTHKERLIIASDVAKAMSFLHQSDVVHRDLKSKNVLINEDKRAKVSDFGFAKLKEESQSLVSSIGGTFAWMAPEALRGEQINAKADVYSFGVILWELMTNQIPWGEFQSLQIPGAVGYGGKKLPVPEGWPANLQQLLDKCLDGIPANRPPFDQIAADLENIMGSIPIQTLPHSFHCPITGEVLVDPVICDDGHTYEREAIAKWLSSHDTSPITNLPLANKVLRPNHNLKSVIQEMKSNKS